jgi:bifunctional UDP-N-acetylglucosamine pyrophosphorylase / glucosamine-1-phosphate N-acetyltransferase
MSEPLHIVILAAGKGTRMKSELPKVLHAVGGAPMVAHVMKATGGLTPDSTTVVVGHRAENVAAAVGGPNVQTVIQEPQKGTAHALLQTEPLLGAATGTLVLVYGDVPLLTTATLRRLVDQHRTTGAAATILTAHVPNPTGYGRIVREDDRIARIVEEKDASPTERAITEINSGIYAFDLSTLFAALHRITPQNAQAEYYLTDLVGILRGDGLVVETLRLESADELRGINSRRELAEMHAIMRDARNAALMASGVTLLDPATTWVGPDVEVGADTVLHPSVYLDGRTRIGARCEIHAGVRIVDSVVADDVIVQNYCVIRESTIDAGVTMGPFAHLRPASHLGAGAHVGNFVELKKASMGAGAKAGHLAYLGDATIGANVNIGAGTITCNYDGEKKHQTVIGEGAFIGSDSQLVAPVTVGAGAYVAAGSSITKDVPDGALAIARSRQETKPGWAEKRRAARAAARKS